MLLAAGAGGLHTERCVTVPETPLSVDAVPLMVLSTLPFMFFIIYRLFLRCEMGVG